MEASIASTRLVPAGAVSWRTYPLQLVVRTDPGFTLSDCLTLTNDPKANPVLRMYKGAIRATFIKRSDRPIGVSALQIGDVHILSLPGEPMVCFQLYAQKLRPADFVAVAGYGDGGPGYLCHKSAFAEGAYEPTSSNTTSETEELVDKALDASLGSDK